MNPKIAKEAATYIHQAFDDGYAAAIEDAAKAITNCHFEDCQNRCGNCKDVEAIKALLAKGTK